MPETRFSDSSVHTQMLRMIILLMSLAVTYFSSSNTNFLPHNFTTSEIGPVILRFSFSVIESIWYDLFDFPKKKTPKKLAFPLIFNYIWQYWCLRINKIISYLKKISVMKSKVILSMFIAWVICFNVDAQVTNPYSKSRTVENEIKRHKKKDKETEEKQKTEEESSDKQTQEQQSETAKQEPQLKWSKYDFIPGEKVIFEDDLQNEENGEFPSRWDLKQGNVEIAEFGGENVIMFRDDHPEIIPYMADPSKDYLPEIFTIEFDLYCGADKFSTYLYDRKNQRSGSPTGFTELKTTYKEMEFGTSSSRLPDEKTVEKRRWIHIAIAYNKGKLKTYLDQTRLINIPRLDFDPKGLSLHSYHARNDNHYYVKNIRIAEGGKKYYDRIMEDGKIIATGIRFDSGKATLKPESMGIINEMVEVMDDHPDLKISIEGHTDSDGNETSNRKLSEARAKTVKDTMVKLGISADRLSTKGFGESTPINNNNSPEGKANNRRVEFVKI